MLPIHPFRRLALPLLCAACIASATLPAAIAAAGEAPRSAPSSFDTFLTRYRAAPVGDRPALARAFVEARMEHGGFPLIGEDGTVTFVYLHDGPAFTRPESVRLIGDFETRSFHNVYWDEEGVAMERVAPEDPLWLYRMELPTDARLEYRVLVDGDPRVDPLNPRSLDGGIYGDVSAVVMPEYQPPSEVEERPGVPKGRLATVEEEWASPAITLYLPPGYDPERTYPTLVTADGTAWIDYGRLPTILDNLIADGEIEPLVAVMIDAAEDRTTWYHFNDGYLGYLERVLTWVDERYATRPRAAERVHAGTSAGGKAALYAALERPDLFGGVAMLSPSLSGPIHWWQRYLSGRKRPPADLRVFLSAGTFEPSIHADALTARAWLERAGLDPELVVTNEAHNFGTWRHMIPKMLRYFFGAPPSPPTPLPAPRGERGAA